ncbi:UvrD-helicase domain-containing protein [Streptomyces sp. NBC_01363]|uniref:UvrD-helicase domain-containing protein n=1 Tax=Streptomyces sp. NBC_01363 TaxID=2903840 RepID=UPI002255E4D8|nr:UvrD-helicase domain-containing protein [Streptomyces sp. NBC_01363]MCX4735484.1 AAA family ATPase [Streptomyces sp. NBC_01363]
MRLGGNDWLLVSVKHRGHVHRNLDRFAYGINQITGAIEYVDLQVVEEDVLGAEGSGEHAEKLASEAAAADAPLFSAYTAKQLADLGVAEPLIPIALKLTTDDELLGLAEYAPRHTGEVLLRLRDGVPYQQVMDEVTAPVAVASEESPKSADSENWRAAADRSQAVVITDDESLRGIIEEGDFGRWKVFLHPTQERLVGRTHSGSARVSGGPATGKTIVALHRVKHLVEKRPPGHNKPVLFTTFNKNLAADLRTRLLSLGGPQLLARVDILHVDQLATHVVSEADPGNAKRRIDDTQALREWRQLLVEAGESRWDAEFLCDEWNQVCTARRAMLVFLRVNGAVTVAGPFVEEVAQDNIIVRAGAERGSKVPEKSQRCRRTPALHPACRSGEVRRQSCLRCPGRSRSAPPRS